MPKEKYTCRCGKKTDKLTSYFKDGMRVTVCDDCAVQFGLHDDEDVLKVDYDKVKKSAKDEFYHRIDTREK